jgi:hypothetical protein
MVVVNCDQDYKPDLNPRPLMTTEAESDTPTVTAIAMSTTTDTSNQNMSTGTTKNSTNPVVDAAVSEVWYLKPIKFAGRRTRVVTQNFNGSVSIAYRTAAAPEHVAKHFTSVPQPMLVYSHM